MTRWRDLLVFPVAMFLLVSCGQGFQEKVDGGDTSGNATTAAMAPGIVGDHYKGADAVDLNLLTAFSSNNPHHSGVIRFAQRLKEKAPWININYIGAAEVLASEDQVQAVANETYDLVDTTSAYYSHLLPEADSFYFRNETPAVERQNGIHEAIQRFFDKIGIYHLGTTLPGGTYQYSLFLGSAGKEVDPAKPSLKGMQIRGGLQYDSAIQTLGARRVSMPMQETAMAMQQGLVDGFGGAEASLKAQGLEDIVKYQIDPSFNYVTFDLLVNKKRWEKLDERTRQAMLDTMKQVEDEMVQWWKSEVNKAEQRRQDVGIEVITFTGEVRERFLQEASCGLWRTVIAQAPATKELHDRWGYRCF